MAIYADRPKKRGGRKVVVRTRDKAEAAEEPKMPKSPKGSMDWHTFQSVVKNTIEDAVSYIESSELKEDREQATDYYRGRLPDVDGDTVEEDRSQAVLSEVRDTTMGMMPDLLRIFLSSGSVVRYKPVGKDDEEFARQATDYVRHVVLGQDNDFFRICYDSIQDALVRKTGFLKWDWVESEKPKFDEFQAIDDMMLSLMAGEDSVEIVEQREYEGLEGEKLYDVKLKSTVKSGKVKIWAIPCEEVFVSSRARDSGSAPIIGHRSSMTVSDLVALGYAYDEVADLDDLDSRNEDQETMARLPGRGSGTDDASDAANDPTLKPVLYTEAYMRVDFDGDGIAELRKICCGGTGYRILHHEAVDDVQMTDLCPYMEAHSFFGLSVADLTMDIQRISSRIMRDTLDSLAQSIKPRTGVVEGMVNLDDVLNPDTSNVIRMRQPGMVQDLKTDFVGRDGLPVIEYLKTVREGRTGISDASQGLDPDILQSTTQSAVSATLTRAQARIEMVARTLAETGFKRLFKGVLKLLVKHQDKPRTVRLRNQWVDVAPSEWSPEMDAEVDFPLGRGSPIEQISFLTQILAKQEAILQTAGLINPFVTPEQYSTTMHRIVELGGYPNTEAFFLDISKMDEREKASRVEAMSQTMAAASGGGQSAGPAPVDPAIEQAKIRAKTQVEMEKIKFDREKLAAEMQLEGARIQSDAQIRVMEIQAKYKETMDAEQIRAASKANSDQIDAQTRIAVEMIKPRGGADKGSNSGRSSV